MNKLEETTTALKMAMGYRQDTECCASCKKFQKATGGGMMIGGGSSVQSSKGDRCNLNVIEVPVSTGGRCNHFKKREPLAQLVDIHQTL